jgi:hypothetical protein
MSTATLPTDDLKDPELLRQVSVPRRIDNWTNWLYLAASGCSWRL